MYSDVFCKVYNEFGWNYYPEVFGERLLLWLREQGLQPETAMDLACGTGILCRILRSAGIRADGMDFSAGMIRLARENCPEASFEVADMTLFRPDKVFDLVTCTGDAVNHIPDLRDVEKIFRNVHSYLAPGGWFVFDLLNRKEVSDSEPFDMDYDAHTRVWFQMTRPGPDQVNLQIRVFEDGQEAFTENIRETIHDPERIMEALERCGFSQIRCTDRLPETAENPSTTWFILAQK